MQPLRRHIQRRACKHARARAPRKVCVRKAGVPRKAPAEFSLSEPTDSRAAAAHIFAGETALAKPFLPIGSGECLGGVITALVRSCAAPVGQCGWFSRLCYDPCMGREARACVCAREPGGE